MANKKTEGTEEETPKTRKEIRQERRQMKAVNAGRKEMGGDELYTKKEIRDVNKPFEPQASEVLTGTKQGVGNSSTTYNDPNKPAEKEYEYKAYNPGGYSSKAKPLSEEEYEKRRLGSSSYSSYDHYLKSIQEQKTIPSSETEKENITKEQFVSLNADDPNTGEAVKKVLVNNIVSDNNTSLEEKQKLIEATNVVKTEVNKTDEQINDQTKEEEKIISTTDPNAIGGSGASVAGVMDKAPTGPEWTSVVPTGQQYQAPSREEIYEQARQAKSKAPQLAIEKLGLQDYYPEAGRNIAVGTFTGSRIGSQTIYSGAGGLLPLGLYDARKRAIATEIKKKEAIMDQLKEMPDIAKQFKPYYSEKYMDFLSPWMDAFKDKPEELMRNSDFLKGVRQYQAIGENFLKVDADLKEFEALINPGDKGAEKGGYGAYATPAMLEILHNFNAGMLPGEIEKYFDGSKNISDLTKTIQAMPSGYKWADETVKLILEKGQAEIPIYPKDGVNWRDPKVKEAAMKDVNGLVVSLKDGSPDYETYLTSLKKYFSFDFETMTKEWIEGNSLNALTDKEKEEYKKSLTAYMLSKMPPDSIVNKVEMQTNDEAERANAQLDYQASMAKIAADREMFYADFNRHTSATRALYEGMERLGSNSESINITDGGVSDKDGMKMEWEVYNKNTGKFDWYSGAEIKKFPDVFFKNKSDALLGKNFIPNSTVYVVPTSVDMKKYGSNYNVSTSGNAYESSIDLGGGEKIGSTPVGVRTRTPYATAVTNGNLNDGPIISSDNAIGAKFQRSAGNVYSGGGQGRKGGSTSSSSRE